MDQPPQASLYFDGHVRSVDAQKKLNEMAAAVFETPAGREYMNYLRSITVFAVCGPEITDAGLRHREGARSLVAVISQQIEAHHREQRKQSRTDPDAGTWTDKRPGSRTRRVQTRLGP